MQAVVVPDSAIGPLGPIHRSIYTDLVGRTALDGCFTLHETFQTAAMRFEQSPCLGERARSSIPASILPASTPSSAPSLGRFLFESYADVATKVAQLGSGMDYLDCLRSQYSGDKDGNMKGVKLVGLYMKNCKEWIVAENACYSRSAATVPMYDTLGADVLQFIINETKLCCVICSDKEIDKLNQVANACHSLKFVIVVATFDSKLSSASVAKMNRGGERPLRFMLFEDVLRLGRAFPTNFSPPSPADLATLCYTSGTTGVPKGAMITHGNMISVAGGGVKSTITVKNGDYYLSFLPLAHIFERIVVNGLLSQGAAIGFYSGDINNLVEDLKALQPTVMCAVPRLLTRIHDKVMKAVNAAEGSKGYLLRTAFQRRHDEVISNGPHAALGYYSGVLDRLVMQPIRQSLGMERVRILVSGGAPLPVESMLFFNILMAPQCNCFEGYGMTETSGCTTITPSYASIADRHGQLMIGGNVGIPLPICDVRLVDVPDMGYYHTDTFHSSSNSSNGSSNDSSSSSRGEANHRIPCRGRGEIWARGPGIFGGYFNNPAATRDCLTTDGWLKSGDVGMFTVDGRLIIIDRIKNLLKLSQGEYVAVEKVEGVLSQSRLVSQICVHGDSNQNKLIAIVVPDADALLAWANTNTNSARADITDALNVKGRSVSRSGFIKALLEDFASLAKRANLMRFEYIYGIVLVDISSPNNIWSVENGLLTPTMKLKRNLVRDKFVAEISAAYRYIATQEGNATNGSANTITNTSNNNNNNNNNNNKQTANTSGRSKL